MSVPNFDGETADDGVREISPITFFPRGENASLDLATPNLSLRDDMIIPEVDEPEEAEAEVTGPKDSSAQASATSLSKQDDLSLTPLAIPSPAIPAPTAPELPTPTAARASGKSKESETSKPVG